MQPSTGAWVRQCGFSSVGRLTQSPTGDWIAGNLPIRTSPITRSGSTSLIFNTQVSFHIAPRKREGTK
jgi:hypothetical protein